MSTSKTPPPWAGKSGPGYAFDEEGELLWFASASSMKPKLPSASAPPKRD